MNNGRGAVRQVLNNPQSTVASSQLRLSEESITLFVAMRLRASGEGVWKTAYVSNPITLTLVEAVRVTEVAQILDRGKDYLHRAYREDTRESSVVIPVPRGAVLHVLTDMASSTSAYIPNLVINGSEGQLTILRNCRVKFHRYR